MAVQASADEHPIDLRREAIQGEAIVLARDYGLDLDRVRRVLERHAVDWEGRQLPRVEEPGDFLRQPAWCVENLRAALSHLSPEDALALCEGSDPVLLSKRSILLDFLLHGPVPFYTLDELADLMEAYRHHRERNRDRLVETGYPSKNFARSPWLDGFLTPLLPVKVPVGVNDPPWVMPQDAEGNRIFSYTWPVEAAPRAQMPAPGARISVTALAHLDPPRTCAYTEAVLMDGMPSDLARVLEDTRPRLLQVQLDVLRICTSGLRLRNAVDLWPEVVTQLTRAFTPSEAQRLVSVARIYDECDLARHLGRRLQVFLPPHVGSGLAALLTVVGHCVRELRCQAFDVAARGMSKVRQQLGTLDSYVQVVGHPAQGLLNTALDSFMERDAQEHGFWEAFARGVDEAVATEFSKDEVTLSVRLSMDQAASFRSVIEPYWNLQLGQLRTTGQVSCVDIRMVQQPAEDQDRPRIDGPRRNGFCREGEYWTISYEGKTMRLKDAKGLRYISYMLERPGKEIHVLQLQRAVDGMPVAAAQHPSGWASAEQLAEEGLVEADSDNHAVTLTREDYLKYQDGLEELKRRLAEARQRENTRLVKDLEDRIRTLKQRMSADFGLGARARNSNQTSERARKAVSNAVGHALGKIEKEDILLYRHLANAIRCGTYLSYQPEQPVTWEL
jgi:hypothetical protein